MGMLLFVHEPTFESPLKKHLMHIWLSHIQIREITYTKKAGFFILNSQVNGRKKTQLTIIYKMSAHTVMFLPRNSSFFKI
jgi:primase-polymerase (primpol)-like protein